MHAPSPVSRWPRRKIYSIGVGLTITTILLCLLYRGPSVSMRGIATTTSADDLDSEYDEYSQPFKFATPTPSPASASKSSPTPTPEYDLPPGILELIQPHITSISAPTFTSRTGKVYHLPTAPKFTQPLRNQILILDVESRDIGGPGGLLDDGAPNTDELQGLTLGRLNHYMFAKLHGYDYQLAQLPIDPTLHGTWNKVPAMREAIKHYEYVVFMDGDAIFTHMHLPLEWLLNYWSISGNATMALAEDPSDPFFLNVKKLDTNLNTGFVIAHQTPRSEEFFEAWMTCPDEKRYAGCGVWKLRHTHEQAVVNEYLRYDYPDEIQKLPCTEANRYPNADDECAGEFISHYWPFKDMIPGGVKEVMAQYFWPPLQKSFAHDRTNIIKTMNGTANKGAVHNDKMPDAGEQHTN